MKTCTKCGETKALEDFSRHKTTQDRLNPQCRSCLRAYMQAYYAANKEALCRKNKEYAITHKAELQEYSRQYRIANKDQIAIRDRAYYKSNKEKWIEREKRIRDSETTLIKLRTINNAAARKWRKANKEKKNVLTRNRRAKLRQIEGQHSASDIAKMLEGQKHRCWWCGKKMKKHHVDHRIPIALGGTNDPANLVLACLTCNVCKWKKMPAEFCGRLL